MTTRPDSAFWGGRRVFLTGHTGFKGGWLALWLQRLGAEVTGFALEPPGGPNLFEVARVADGMTDLRGDVREGEALAEALCRSRAEVVFHLAAQPLVRLSYVQPAVTFATNVMGTVNLLEAVRRHDGIRAVVNVTTDKCYENHGTADGYREGDPLGGYDPYSSSKACSELVTAAYRNSFFNPADHGRHGVALATARSGNVLGGGDWAEDRLVPDCLRCMMTGEPVPIRNPRATRPWQHVLAPLAGYLLLAERLYAEGGAFAEAWNFGPDDADVVTVHEVAARLCALWGGGASCRVDGGEHPHEAATLRLDSGKARQRLGWRPRWSLAKGLEQTVTWHKAWLGETDMRETTLAQIEDYQCGGAA